MTSTTDESAAYVLGHSERELARLERQAGFFGDMTRDVLVRAGLKPGMKVLDIGCGVGDVTSIAADLVGPEGEVLGIDISAEALAIAEARLKALGKTQARFLATPVETFTGFDRFDAVVGRFILVHMGDPAGLVRTLAGKLKPGTILAFAEMDMSTAGAKPALPLLDANIARILEVYRRAGRQSDMGSALFATFRGAGLSPQMMGYTRIAGGDEADGLAFVTESVRSLLPFMEKLGIASAQDVGIDTLYQRLAADAGASDHCVFYPRLVGCWATV